MTRKADTIRYKEFNKLTDHSDTNHDPLPSEVLFDDENTNQLEETLMGMEYELEDLETVYKNDVDNDEDEDEDEDENEDEDEDYIEADLSDEIDKGNHYQGRQI